MDSLKKPKLRRVQKYSPPYVLNRFPPTFALNLGKEIVYLLASKGKPVLEGSDWEEIFANCIDASWRPSNIGLDDVVKHQCALFQLYIKKYLFHSLTSICDLRNRYIFTKINVLNRV